MIESRKFEVNNGMVVVIWVSLFLLFLPHVLLAAPHHTPEGEIPWWPELTGQVFNLAFAVFVIYWFFGKPIAQYFAGRQQTFYELLNRAEDERKIAEGKHKEIRLQLQQLRGTEGQNKQRALAEAEELRNRLLQDARSSAQRVKDDARRLAEYEADRAYQQIRLDMLDQASGQAQKMLVQTNAKELKRLDQQFVEKIEVLH